MKLLSFLQLLVFINAGLVKLCFAKGITSKVGAACFYTANNLTDFPFDCPPLDLSYKCRCKDKSFLGTVLICVDDNAEEVDIITEAYHYLMDVCSLQANINHKFKGLAAIFENATDFYINDSQIKHNVTLRNPARIDDKKYQISLKSIEGLLNHRHISTIFGLWLLVYWAIVILCGTIFNITVWCAPSCLMNFNNATIRWIRRHVIMPQMFARNIGKRRSNAISRYVSKILSIAPTRFQAITISVYCILVIIFGCIKYDYIMPNTVMGAMCVEHRIYIADRAGILAISQLPLIFGFAGRNNIFMLFTGWPYRTFNIFHRWISRIVFILMLIHASLYIDFTRRNGDYYDKWSLVKWRFANTALIASCLLFCFSFHTIRERLYEYFKTLHKIFAIIFVIGTWYHCFTLGWMEFLYVTISLWCFDYFIRGSKILISGGVVYAKCQAITENVSGRTRDGAEVPFKKRVHSIRVTLDHSGWWRAFPGCFVYIYFLKSNMFWQSHPFTIIESSNAENFNQLVLVIRVKNGLTKKLGKWLLKQPNQEARIPVLVEGPYGAAVGFSRYENGVFIAGGIGFTVVYSLAMDLARLYRSEELRGIRNVVPNSIQLIWITPGSSNVVANIEEIVAISHIGKINLSIYITRDPGPPRFIKVNDGELIQMDPNGNVKQVTDMPLTAGSATNNEVNEDDENFDKIKDFGPEGYQEQLIEIDNNRSGTELNPKEIDTQEMNSPIQNEPKPNPLDSGVIDANIHTLNFKTLRAKDTCKLFKDGFPNVEIFYGIKPDIKEETIRIVNAMEGSTAIIACGPDILNCDIRDGAAKCLKAGAQGSRVDYFEEKLLW